MIGQTNISNKEFLVLQPSIRILNDAYEASLRFFNGDVLMPQSDVMASFIGEFTIISLLGYEYDEEAVGSKDPGYDCIHNGLRIDVKNRTGNYAANNTYNMSLSAKQVHNNSCDVYVFTHWNKNLETVTVLGWITKNEFLARSTLVRAGEYMPGGNFNAWQDKYDIPISMLWPVREANDLLSIGVPRE